jgi:hypothetical protein
LPFYKRNEKAIGMEISGEQAERALWRERGLEPGCVGREDGPAQKGLD